MKYLHVLLALAFLPAAAALSPAMCNTTQASDVILTGQLLEQQIIEEDPSMPSVGSNRERSVVRVQEVEKGTLNDTYVQERDGQRTITVTGWERRWDDTDLHRIHVQERSEGYELVFCAQGSATVGLVAQEDTPPVNKTTPFNSSGKAVVVDDEQLKAQVPDNKAPSNDTQPEGVESRTSESVEATNSDGGAQTLWQRFTGWLANLF